MTFQMKRLSRRRVWSIALARMIALSLVGHGDGALATQAPPSGILLPPPQFHLSNGNFEEELERQDQRVDQAYARYHVAVMAAYAALGAGARSSIGSPEWLGARKAVRSVLSARDALRSVLYERIAFFDRIVRAVPEDEVASIRTLRQNSQNEVAAIDDRSLSLLRSLTRIDS